MAEEDKPKLNGNGKDPEDKEKEPAGKGKAPVDVLDRAATRKGSVQQAPGWGAAIPLTVMFAAAADGAPQWWSPARDIYLDRFWKTEGLLSGTIYSMAARNASYNFQLTGPPEVTEKSQKMLMGAEFGAGWQTFVLKVSQDLLGQDNGCFMEVVRPARANFKWLGEHHTALAQKALVNGETQWCAVGRGNALLPLAGLDYDIKDSPGDQAIGVAHLDAQACSRTGDDEYPVIYVDRLGVPHKLAWYQVLTMEDLPTARQSMNGVSFCAVSRVLRASQILREIRQYQYEKVSGRFNRAVHMVNVDAEVIQQQMQQAEADADNRGLLRYMHPIIISTLDPQATPTVATINLAGLPDNFDTEKFLTWYITEMALGTGVDYGFLAPLPGTGLGSASQSETMARQSRGKSARLFMNMMAAKFNFGGVLPKSVEMEFHEIDYEEEAAKAGVASTRASTRAARITSGEITPTVARQIAEDEGDLDHDYLEILAEEDATREEIIQSWQQPGAQIVGDPKIMGKLGAQVKKEQAAAAQAKPGAGGLPGAAPGGGGLPGAAPAGPAAAAATPLSPSPRQQLIRQAAAKLGAQAAAAPAPGVADHAAVTSTEKPTAGKPAPKAKPVKATLSAGKKALPTWAYAEQTNGGVRFLRRASDNQWVLVNAAEKQLATGLTPMAALARWQAKRETERG